MPGGNAVNCTRLYANPDQAECVLCRSTCSRKVRGVSDLPTVLEDTLWVSRSRVAISAGRFSAI